MHHKHTNANIDPKGKMNADTIKRTMAEKKVKIRLRTQTRIADKMTTTTSKNTKTEH